MKIKEVYLETSEKVFGYRDKKQKEWMSDATWNKMKDRKEIKSGINNSETRKQKAIAQAQYTEANIQVKRSVKRDKRQWVDKQAQKAEEAEKRRNLRELYNVTKRTLQCNQKNSTI
jgi:ABC-type sugar transport system ATPase subunit